MRYKYWLTCEFATVYVEVTNGEVVDTANIFKVWKGQPFDRMVNWIKSKCKNPETVRYEEMK